MRSTRIRALHCALLISIMQLASGQARTSAPATAHAVVDAEDAGALRSGVVDLQEGVIRAPNPTRACRWPQLSAVVENDFAG